MWVMTAIAIVGFYFNMKLSKWGYVLWIVSDIGFAINGIYAKQYPLAGLFIFYILTCIVGFMEWNKRDNKVITKQTKLIILQKTLDKNFKKGDTCRHIIDRGKQYLINIGNGKKIDIGDMVIKLEEVGVVNYGK